MSQVRNGDVRAVRARLMEVLSVTTRMSFLDWMNGKVQGSPIHHEAVERVFAEFGITDIWGEVPYITKISETV